MGGCQRAAAGHRPPPATPPPRVWPHLPTDALLNAATLAGLLAMSAFFSGSETAIFSLGDVELDEMESSDSAPARRAAELARRPHRTLVTILLANMIVNVALSVVATGLCLAAFGERGLVVAIPSITIALLLFGEIVPKTLGLRLGRPLAEFAGPPLYWLARLLGPVQQGLEFMATRASGRPTNRPLDRDELGTLVEVAQEEGELTPFEARVLRRILEFTDTSIEYCLTPRVDMASIELGSDEADVRRLFESSGRSRLPVHEGSRDRVVGMLFLKDFLTSPAPREVAALMREPYFVPETVSAAQLFAEFQRRRVHIAVVVGEHGGVEGVVTLEDLLEEIVGDIRDESDEPERDIEPLGDGSWRVHAQAELDDVADALGVRWGEDDEAAVTMSGLLQRELGRVPQAGDEVERAGLRIRVTSARPNRPVMLRVRHTGGEEPA